MPQADGSVFKQRGSSLNGSRPTTCMKTEGRSRLIFGEDERVANWVKERLPNFIGWNGAYVAIGYELQGKLRGGVTFTQYCHPNIVIACALEAPLTRRFLRGIFYYPFHQLEVRRVTALIDAKNAKSRALVEHAGFTYEGTMAEAAPDDDVVIYGLLRRNCRWLG